jgi:hypothetical protein
LKRGGDVADSPAAGNSGRVHKPDIDLPVSVLPQDVGDHCRALPPLILLNPWIEFLVEFRRDLCA